MKQAWCPIPLQREGQTLYLGNVCVGSAVFAGKVGEERGTNHTTQEAGKQHSSL